MAKKNKKITVEPIRFNPSIEDGLTDEQINEHIRIGAVNKIIKKTGKSYFRIVIDNFCTLFNFMYLAVFVLLLTSQLYSHNFKLTNYTFVVVVIINILIGTIQEIKSKMTISKLQLISQPTVTVIRNKSTQEINVENVVLDDIVYLTPGKEICTDSILMKGEVEVNESQLTGESVPIRKNVGDVLYSGSFVVSGNAFVKVERVGSDNAIEKLASEAKQYKKPNSQILTTIRGLIKVIAVFLVITGVLMVLQNYDFRGHTESGSTLSRYLLKLHTEVLAKLFKNASNDWNTTITSTCTALLGMIPSGLLMMTSAALVLGVIRLSKHQTLVQEIYCVEMLARVDVLCLDKTGTITNGEMKVVDFIDMQKEKFAVKDIISSLNAALSETNATAKALEKYFGKEEIYSPLAVIPFSSDRKYSGAEFSDGTYLIGAPEFVLKTSFSKYQDKVNEYASHGNRVLALAYSTQDVKNGKMTKAPKLIAFILIEDQIREEAEATIRYFRESGVEVKVISGDNPVTVSEVARKVGIARADHYISLDGLTDEEVYKAASNYTVFGRVKPNQKQIIVRALKDQKRTVAMTGDGVNDILALKEADCSIAMASGSDAVRSVAQLVLLDSNFASMPKVVDEGRRAINNVQQISMLFLVKTFFVVTLAFLTVIGFFKKTSLNGDGSFPFANPTQLLMLELFVIGIPSTFLTIQPNTNRVTGNFLWNVLQKSLPGVVAIVVAVVTTYLLSKPCGIDIYMTKTIVVVTTTYIGLMILYLACRPFTWKKVLLFVSMTFLCSFFCIESMHMFPEIIIAGKNISMIISEQFDLVKLYMIMDNGKLNLTPLLLALILVALSYIIMSITAFIIGIINRISLSRGIRKAKFIFDKEYVNEEDPNPLDEKCEKNSNN